MFKDTIKQLIILNQKEIPYSAIAREDPLPLNREKIITIPGVRRCGKSYKMKLAINQLVACGVDNRRILWIGFDDERLKPMTASDLDEIIQSYIELFPDIAIGDVYMFFDEIQLIKGWEYFVLRLYKSYCKNIYISGSNASMLSTELVSALRGYPLEFKTYPLSFREYCDFKSVKTDAILDDDVAKLKLAFFDYNSSSAFPEVVLTESQSEKTMILQAYFDTMLLKDVAERYGISNIRVLRYFAKRLMDNLTKPVSINAIYNDIKSQGHKVSKDSLYELADNLCNIFMFVKLPLYTDSLKIESRSLNKYYCIDNGLRKAVFMPLSPDDGKYFENSVFLELTRRLKPFEKLSYFSEKKECDFVLQTEFHVDQLIQASWSLLDPETRNREINGILEASNATGCNNMMIITYEEEETISINGKTICVVPAWKWFTQI